MTVQTFLQENGIFIAIPLAAGLLKVVHDSLPTTVFLGGAFFLLALYIAVSHIKKSSADSASNQLNDSAKALIKEFNKDARKQARKDNKKTVQKQRQQTEKSRDLQRKDEQNAKETVNSGSTDSPAVPAKKGAKKVQIEHHEEDEGDEALLRLASLQGKRKY